MTIWMRTLVWVAWLAAVGWLWRAGELGTGGALACALLSLLLFAVPGVVHRRRRSSLQYVEMGKQPVGLL
jgi:hypothetical protein